MEIVNFRRIGTRIVGFVKGQMLNRDLGSADKARLVEMLLRDYKEGGAEDQQLWDEIESYLNPAKRILKGELLEVEGGKVYLKGSKIPMPADLGEFMMELAEEGEDALRAYVNFWKLACLAPPKARDSLFGYIQNHGVVITDNGYMLLYKAVKARKRHDESVDLARFVAEQFVAVAVRGDDPGSWVVYQNEDGLYLHDPANYYPDDAMYLGHLHSLMSFLQTRSSPFNHISETETIYTDLWTGTMDIRLGVQQYKDPAECDFDTSSPCGHGLHCGAPSYVKSYGSYNKGKVEEGEELIYFLVLVNPKDVVRAFSHEDKLGTSRYLPIGIMEQDENGNWEAIKQTHFEFDYIDYEVDELEHQYRELENTLVDDVSDDGSLTLLQEQKNIISQRVQDLKTQKPESADSPERSIAPHDRPSDVEDYWGEDDEEDDEDWF